VTGALDGLAAALADRYRIERELGQGGMATVYLAEDLKHNRKVAIKVLKPELAAVLGAERFLQEIATTAALQHPNILPLFDSGEADGFLFYVMPFVEGETLRTKLHRETQFGIAEAVRLVSEVADALQYAHEHGVVHRDIKPENILVHAGRPMVADFGIALAVSAAAGGRMTETGLSLGTPHYMSPEQATAEKTITNRSDIYSLASVLYEMLTGQPPHLGGSAQQIIMKIVTEEAAPATQLRKSVPANVAAALAKALEKLPADRFESAKAFAAALADPAFRHGGMASGAVGVRAPWYRQPASAALAVVAVGLAIALVVVVARGRNQPAARRSPVRFALSADPAIHIDTRTTRPFAVSPDGRTVVFRASTDATPAQLWVRHLDDAEPHPLAGTEGGWNPAISPDGVWVAFITDLSVLRKVRVSGGDVSTVANLGIPSAALSWSSDDEILFEALGGAAGANGIYRVSAVGGRPALAVPVDTAGGEWGQRRPFMLRDAGVVIYESVVRGESHVSLVSYRLSDGHRVRLGIPGIGALAFADGHLIYSLADGTLMAVPFDPSRMRATGAPVELSPRVATNGSIGTAVGLSDSGTLVYRAVVASATAHVELVDTSGRNTRLGDVDVMQLPRFSPDGRRIAMVEGSAAAPQGGDLTGDLWVLNAATGVSTRVTTDGSVGEVSWFPDGRRVAFLTHVAASRGADGGGGDELRSVAVDGSEPASVLHKLRDHAERLAVVPDGKSVIVSGYGEMGPTLLRYWVHDATRVDTLLQGKRAEALQPDYPRVSRDGRWLAFVGGYSSAVWVESLDGQTLLQVSATSSNATPAVWSRDSRHLYYVSTEGLVDIELQTTPTLAVQHRRTIPGLLVGARLYDLSPDGKTFVVVRSQPRANDIVVALGWLGQARNAWQGGGAR
jgi:Tol biopolymer transport system component/tRNA A-37 threonylcarbamoyl transferase component Bud32